MSYEEEMEGGVLYDEAEYGCIFMPTLKCVNNTTIYVDNLEDISNKIMIDKLLSVEDAEHEFKISSYIRKLYLSKNYFVTSYMSCTPDKQQKEKNIQKCTLIEKDSDLSNFRILRMEYGGVPLSSYKLNTKQVSIFPIFKHLLEGVSLLSLYGIVHRDLHQGNILIDSYNVPRIIDFNLSFNVRNNITQKDLKYHYTVKPTHVPPDSMLINAILLKQNPSIVIDRILNNTIMKIIRSVLGIQMDEMLREMRELLEDDIIVSGDVVKWFKRYWPSIDSWAIGANFIYIIHNLLLWPEFKSEWRQLSSKMLPVLKKLCTINPKKRYDAVQALELLDPMNHIIKRKAQKWLSVRNKI